jgi:hypothetical protein
MSDDIKYKNVLCISLVSNISDFAIGFSMVVSVSLFFLSILIKVSLTFLSNSRLEFKF